MSQRQAWQANSSGANASCCTRGRRDSWYRPLLLRGKSRPLVTLSLPGKKPESQGNSRSFQWLLKEVANLPNELRQQKAAGGIRRSPVLPMVTAVAVHADKIPTYPSKYTERTAAKYTSRGTQPECLSSETRARLQSYSYQPHYSSLWFKKIPSLQPQHTEAKRTE